MWENEEQTKEDILNSGPDADSAGMHNLKTFTQSVL